MVEVSNNEELSFDIVELPSKGLFYKNGCKEVKLYYLTMADEELLTSVNLIQSGKMIDVLLERKIKQSSEVFVKPSDMLIGDRLALLVYLRIGMNHIYNMNVRDFDGTYFTHPFDLTTLTVRTPDVLPENGEFSQIIFTNLTTADTDTDKSKNIFTKKTVETTVKYRLMNGLDELEIRESQKRFQNSESKYNQFKLERLITSWNGNTDKGYIARKIETMPLLEGRRILNKINENTPTLDLNVRIPSQRTNGVIDTMVDFSSPEFFFPSI
jgi:hypothetical protein